MVGSSGTREIATRYPVVKGLTAGTTSQTGNQENLIAEDSLIPKGEREGGL